MPLNRRVEIHGDVAWTVVVVHEFNLYINGVFEHKSRVSRYLQLGLALGLLQNGLHLGGLHNVTLDLELAAHEQALSIGLAIHQGLEVRVRQSKSD